MKDGAEMEHRRRLSRERYARKQVEKVDRRKVLGQWFGFTNDAFEAMKDIDRLDKQLGVMAVLLLAGVSLGFGQVPVVSDTNMLRLLPPGVKVEMRTDLYTAETLTFVTTNWIPVGPPVDIVTNGVVIARRQFEAATLLTNVVHSLIYEGIERRFVVSQTTGPILATRSHDFPPKLESHPQLAVPIQNRQQR